MSAAGASGSRVEAPGRLLTPQMRASLIAVFLTFGNLYMVIGVIPIAVRQATGHDSETGLVTAALAFATIVTNLLTPGLMSRRSPARLLGESLLVASAGTAILAAWDGSFPLLLAGGTLQGLGLGVSLVIGVSLITSLAPPGRRTLAVGIYGVAAGMPAVLGPPFALWLLSAFGLRTALGVACGLGLLAVAASTAVRGGTGVEPTPTHGFRAALRSPTVVALFGSFALVTFTFGALLTVIPLSLPRVGLTSAATFLLVFGAARLLARPGIGVIGARVTNERLYLPGLLSALAGAALLAESRAAVSLFIAAVLLGLGFGAFMSASYIGMLEGIARRDDAVVSSLWNFAFDGGVGCGAIAAGALAGAFGYGFVRWLMPVTMTLATIVIVITSRPRSRGSRPAPEAGPLRDGQGV